MSVIICITVQQWDSTDLHSQYSEWPARQKNAIKLFRNTPLWLNSNNSVLKIRNMQWWFQLGICFSLIGWLSTGLIRVMKYTNKMHIVSVGAIVKAVNLVCLYATSGDIQSTLQMQRHMNLNPYNSIESIHYIKHPIVKYGCCLNYNNHSSRMWPNI